jgi:hypothetical protein
MRNHIFLSDSKCIVIPELTHLPANDSRLEMEQIILSDAREGSRQLRLCILWSKADLDNREVVISIQQVRQ